MKRKREKGAVAVYVVLVLGILLTVSLAVASLGTQSLLRVRHLKNELERALTYLNEIEHDEEAN